MSKIAILIAETDTYQDGNYLRIGNELVRRGHDVSLALMESLAMAGSRTVVSATRLNEPVVADNPMPAFHQAPLEDFDIAWIMSLGMRQSFLDKMQLLFSVQQHCRLINSLDAIMHFKSKYFTASHGDVFRHPETWASNDPEELFDVMKQQGGKWIAKPPALSFGRDVYLLTHEDPNAHVILESMCGPDADQYCLLQRYVEEVRQGEKRVILAGGEPVGQYVRVASLDHRTNIEAGATAQASTLSDEERDYCRKIGQRLLEYGAVFVGMDLAYPWVIEFNVINPGGITTIDALTGVDITPAVLDAIGL